MAQIVLDDVEKTYPNGYCAISGLSLEVSDKEFLVLVGPSGCGKSTVLRMIAGLEETTGGTIRIGDRIVNDLAPKDRDIALVFQNYALYPHMTVEQNIGLSLRVAKRPKDEIRRRVAEAARMMELTEQLRKRPSQLSGGQRQRVAMGRAIVREPAAFLMDEPLSNLDAKLRVQVRAEISKLQRRLGVTTVYVTHDQSEAMTMGDRVAVLEDGHLRQVDTPQNLYDRPDNVFVAAFIGSPSMNLFEARLDGAQVLFGPQRLPLRADVFEHRPALADFDGTAVIVGIRPEDLEDAELAPAQGAVLSCTVELVESLGSEIVVHLNLDARRVKAGEPGAAQEVGGDGACVARFSPRSRVAAGRPAAAAVTVENLHFFDPETGRSIRA